MTRLRRAIEVGSRHDSPIGPSDLGRELRPSALAREEWPVTQLLFARLADADVAEIERRVTETGDLPILDQADPVQRQGALLSYGIWLGIDEVAHKTRLPAAQPPPEIHAMARGPLAAAGGIYEADMVVDALMSVGVLVERDIRTALDFGCSSGRLLRVLAAAYPGVRWSGCDPNQPAIAWAADNLPQVEVFVSGNQPPLDVEDRSIDLISAISIWSHFAPDLGLRWFDEMSRIIRPGGHLVFTTHGFTSVAYFAERGDRSAEQAAEIATALYRRGWWYADEFGKTGDWGVVNPAWGSAFVSPEWLLAKLCPSWRVLEFAPGRNQANQDVYVLQHG